LAIDRRQIGQPARSAPKENSMNRLTEISAFALLTIGLAACAGSASSSMNAGQRISERGDAITQYGDEWSAGNKSVREGQKLAAKSSDQIADARKKLAKAEDDQARSQQMIADGTTRMQRSEADYAAVRAGPAAVRPPQT
jgi:septal ring factor EnvC (AmiA/AmiB activator)